MLESMSEQMPDRMLERMSEYAIAMPVPVLSDIRIIYFQMIEGSLEVKLPTIWTVEKQR